MRTTLLLDLAADTLPDRIGWTDAVGSLSFGELRTRARMLAAWLGGEEKATQLVFLGLNSRALPLALFGAGYAGVPFVPVNYRLPDENLRKLVARTAPSIVVVDDDMVDRLDSVAGVELVPASRFAQRFLDAPAVEVDLPEPGEEADIAILLFTSGTTGDPKAAVLRHTNLTSYVMSTVEFLGSDEEEAALVSVPSYHIAGISAILTSVYGGRRVVYLVAFTGEDWVDLAHHERVTHAMLVPTMLDRVLDSMADRGLSLPSLRALSYGGGRMPISVVARALDQLPQVNFVNAYGLTETSSTIALLDPEDHRIAIGSEDPAVRQRLGSVGRPLPSVEVEIRDETGQVVPAGTPGEIYVRGPQVSGEYLGKKMIDAEGWFPTNDAGWLDAEGYLYVDGRLDDVIVRGGENISPGEIEDVLRGHADVADVAVIGLPDDRWGEKVAAVIVSRSAAPDERALADHVRTRLRSTKTPEQWFFIDALPYNEMGKLLRRQLKSGLAVSTNE